MKVTLERLPESRVQLDIEVDQDRVDQQFEAAYRRLAQRARVPGFRPGKAPRHMVERALGKDRLMSEALDKLVPDVYNEAIESQDVAAIGQPELDKLELDPVRLKFIVAVRPTVDLGDYQSIRVDREAVALTDEALTEQMLLLRRRHATHVPVERGAAWDDFVTADVVATVEDEDFLEDKDAEFALREGGVLFVPGLAEAFLDMKAGETKSLELPLPDDFRVERFQGKPSSFTLSIKEVKEEQLPPEDDELAGMVSAEEFPTFESLKKRLVDDMTKSLEEQAEGKHRSAAVDKLVEGATLDYPAVLIEREIDHIINETMGSDRQQYTAYLARIGRSETDYREMFREAANTRLRRSLALAQLAEAEHVDPTSEEVEAEIERMAGPMGEEAARFKELFATAEGIATIRRNLMSQKTLERLAAIARGEGGSAAAASEAATGETTQEEGDA